MCFSTWGAWVRATTWVNMVAAWLHGHSWCGASALQGCGKRFKWLVSDKMEVLLESSTIHGLSYISSSKVRAYKECGSIYFFHPKSRSMKLQNVHTLWIVFEAINVVTRCGNALVSLGSFAVAYRKVSANYRIVRLRKILLTSPKLQTLPLTISCVLTKHWSIGHKDNQNLMGIVHAKKLKFSLHN